MAKKKFINGRLNGKGVGANFTNPTSETIFNLGNFSLTSNFTGRRRTDYSNRISSFNNPITLETIGIDDNESRTINNIDNTVKLNFDYSDIKTYVKYGSSRELFRVSVQNIINKFPASLYLSNQAIIGGNITIRNFNYDSSTNTSTFEVPSDFISNNYTIVFDEGNLSTNSSDNEEVARLRNLNLSFNKYIISKVDGTSNNTNYLVGFTGDTANKPYIDLKVNGNPFPELSGSTTGNTNYHIKPEIREFNKFLKDLSELEKYILKDKKEKSYEFKLKTVTRLENGGVIYNDRVFKWDTLDRYNLVNSGFAFDNFIEKIVNVAYEYDQLKSDLVARMLVPDSIIDFDQTDEKKIEKLLRLYGREFDEIKTFIDSLVTINKTTYDKKKNIPDVLVKNLARTLGWDVFNLVSEDNLVESFFSTEILNNEQNTLPSEIDIELWRRILINTNYFWKSKGTRHAIKSMFMLIGIPDPFINITEYVYTVDGKINPDEVELTLDDLPSASLPYDSEGYPIAPIQTPSFYFQISGDTDGGQSYINLYRNVGFRVNRTIDNKKSWTFEGDFVERQHYTTPNYFQESSKLLINTKEIDVTLDVARAIEYDVFKYNQDVDDPITSSAFTKPYIYINIDLEYSGSAMSFQLPEQPLSASTVQLNFNGITLTKDLDYEYDPVDNEVILLEGSAVTHSNGLKDVITITYLHDRLDTSGYTQIKYLVQQPTVNASGTIIELPENPKGDIQLIINGITLSRSTSLVTGDYVQDQNNPNRFIILNNSLKQFLQTNPIVRIWYIVDDNQTNAIKKSEIHRVDSFNSSKLFLNQSINKFVYTLNRTAFDVESVKITYNGITLRNGIDFTLNPANKRQIILQGNINLGGIIGAYYIVGDGTEQTPLIPQDDVFPNLQDITFLEYLELINRRLINVKNRKVITNHNGGYYPTVLKLYETYLKRANLDDSNPLKSNGYTYKNLSPFLNKYNSFFNRFVDQLLPATIIQRKSGILIRNNSFQKQKFTYRRGVNFNENLNWLGDDGSEFVNELTDSLGFNMISFDTDTNSLVFDIIDGTPDYLVTFKDQDDNVLGNSGYTYTTRGTKTEVLSNVDPSVTQIIGELVDSDGNIINDILLINITTTTTLPPTTTTTTTSTTTTTTTTTSTTTTTTTTAAPLEFIFEIESDSFTLPLVSSGVYNMTVDWGDGNSDNITTFNQSEITHTYTSSGTYEIRISGQMDGWSINNNSERLKLRNIKQWGIFNFANAEFHFNNCVNMIITATDIPNIVGISLRRTFSSCSSITNIPNIEQWDVSNVTDMFGLFAACVNFNQSLNNWNVDNVTNMDLMFNNCAVFNQPLNNWNTSNVTNMIGIFGGCTEFNQPLDNWDVSNVVNFNGLFDRCENFNQPLNNWVTSSVTSMISMFSDATIFNQPLNNWDVSNVTDMNRMFTDATNFDQPLDNWNISNVTNLSTMFQNAINFNQPLNNWNTSNVTRMSNMFNGAINFNQPINNWDVSNVVSMNGMFSNGAPLSTNNYDDMLISWSSLPSVQNGVSFSAPTTNYSSNGQPGRGVLISTYGWNINDGGLI